MQKKQELNFFKADKTTARQYKEFPDTLEEAKALAQKSEFIKKHLPESIINIYCK